MRHWRRVKKSDPRACALADRHYSRRKIGSPQFMPPGQTIVLLADDALFGWWRPAPSSGIPSTKDGRKTLLRKPVIRPTQADVSRWIATLG